MLHKSCLFLVSVTKGSHVPLDGLSHVLLGVPPRSVPALSLLLLRPRPTKFVKNFAQLFMKGNELQVVLSRIITRYPPLSIDPPVSLEVEVIANWPQNCSLPLGLARKRVFVSSCNPSGDLLLFYDFFGVSQHHHLAPPQTSSPLSIVFGLGRWLGLGVRLSSGCRHVLSWK